MTKPQRDTNTLALFGAIMDRAWPILKEAGWPDRNEIAVKLMACHLRACPLRFQEMLDGRDIDLIHDVAGIARHYNLATARLERGFLPRYADLPVSLTEDQVAVGTRIRLVRGFGGGHSPGDIIGPINAGETAEIIEVKRDDHQPDAEMPFFVVRFDNHLETLDEWQNTFQIGFSDTEYGWDSTIEDWEVIPGFY